MRRTRERDWKDRGKILIWPAVCLMMILMACGAAGEESAVYNRITGDEREYTFDPEDTLLEIVIPGIASCDAAILRTYGDTDHVMMIDAGYDSNAYTKVYPALQKMGITHVDMGFVSHPHNDHLKGYENLLSKGITFGKLVYTNPEDQNWLSAHVARVMRENGTAIGFMEDGDTFTFAGAHFTVIHRSGPGFTTNDLSGMLMIQYGERTYFTTGDGENMAQDALVKNPPECGLKADVLKYPHHGYAIMNTEFLEMIDPECVFITGDKSGIDQAVKFLERRNIPWFRPYPRGIQMLTDGKVWVIDYFDTVEY